jgi:hypothetical protein
MGYEVFLIGYEEFLMGYEVFLIGNEVFLIGYEVFLIGYEVLLIGYEVWLIGYEVFLMGYVVIFDISIAKKYEFELANLELPPKVSCENSSKSGNVIFTSDIVSSCRESQEEQIWIINIDDNYQFDCRFCW